VTWRDPIRNLHRPLFEFGAIPEPVRNWAICCCESNRILGGVEVRDLGEGEVNPLYMVELSPERGEIGSSARSRLSSRLTPGSARRQACSSGVVARQMEASGRMRAS
jgi:hypothetical protein